MKKVLAIFAALFLSIGVYALDKIAISDSLTAYAQRRARMARVTINKIQQRGNNVQLYTNKSLSYMPISQRDVDSLHSMVSQMVLGNKNGNIIIMTDGHEISELVDNQKRNHFTIPSCTPLVTNASRPYSIKNGLEGRHIVTYGSHGIYYVQSLDTWKWQRAKLLTTVEDLYTTSYTMPFLVPMLENAGAIVMQPRERCTNRNEIIVDDNPTMLINQTQNGAYFWQRDTTGGWGDPDMVKDGSRHQWLEGENPFTMGGYLYAPCSPSETHTLYYKPFIPEVGEYAVYISYKSLPESTKDATYIVKHKGQETIFKVNQQMGGGTWIYLGTFEFGQDQDNNYVSLSNKGKSGTVITSDAIRFGGGMGDIARYPSDEMADNQKSSEQMRVYHKQANYQHRSEAYVSGYPRWIEGSRYYLQYAGIPDSVYNMTHSANDYTDDFSSRGRWMNYLAGGSVVNPNNPGLGIPIELYLAFHSDAGVTNNDRIVGTLLIYTEYDDEKKYSYETGISRMAARDFGNMMQTEIVNDMRALYAPEWTRRQLQNESYSETRNPKVPALILELLSHQNFADMRYGLDPRIRFTISRSIYKSMLKFIANQYERPYVVEPLPIKDFSINWSDENDTKNIVLTWNATPDTLEPSATPTYYIVYTRENGGDWDNGTKVNENRYSLTMKNDIQYDFKIAAGNSGGISLESETLSAYNSSQSKGNVLIVNGFTRLSAPDSFADSTYAGFVPGSYGVPYKKDVFFIGNQYEFKRDVPWRSDDDQGFGACYANYASSLIAGNLFDYPVMHGKVLSEMGYSYVSTSASALEQIPTSVDILDIIMGKQKETTLGVVKKVTEFKTFSPKLQQVVREYTSRGGRLLLSGAYIGSDLSTNKTDTQFASEVLHIKFDTRHATTDGKISIRKGLPTMNVQLQMTPDENISVCEDPDGLLPVGEGAIRIGYYTDCTIPAGVAYDGTNKGMNKSLVFAFPLESIHEFEPLFKNSIEYLSK